MKKRLLSILLVGVLAISLLVGCGDDPANNDDKQNEEDNKEQEGGKDNEKEDGKENEKKEIVELTWYSAWASGSVDDVPFFTDRLAEEVGVKFTQALGCGDYTIYESLLAAGELTDIVTLRGDNRFLMATDANALVNLEDYKDQLPNIFENDLYTAGNKKTAALTEGQGQYGVTTQVGENTGLLYTPKIQWELYYELGCPEIKDYDDLFNVLVEMQKLKPETEDGMKVYAFSFWNDWDKTDLGFQGYINALFGTVANIVHYYWAPGDMSNGTQYAFGEDSDYVNFLEFLNKCARAGLVDPESATQNFETVKAKMAQGAVLFDIGIGESYGDYNEGTGYAPISCDFMNVASAAPNPAGYSWYWGISATTEHLDECLAFLNWFYDNEVQDWIMNGPEGGIWQWNEDHTLRVATDAYKAEGRDTVIGSGGSLKQLSSFLGAYATTNSGKNLGAVVGSGTQANRLTNDLSFYAEEDSLVEQQWKEVYGEQYDWSTIEEWYEDQGTLCVNKGYREFLPNANTVVGEDKMNQLAEVGLTIPARLWKALYAETDDEFWSYIDEVRADLDSIDQEYYQNAANEMTKQAVEKAKGYGIN